MTTTRDHRPYSSYRGSRSAKPVFLGELPQPKHPSRLADFLPWVAAGVALAALAGVLLWRLL
jgi:hypothetical protein